MYVKRFRQYLGTSKNGGILLVLLLSIAFESRDNPSQAGLVRMCVFLAQSVSCEISTDGLVSAFSSSSHLQWMM